MKRKEIAEGNVHAIPLRDDRYAICIITRHARTGATVGYFYGPPVRTVPTLPEHFYPSQVVLVARFGDYPIVNNVWPFIGKLPQWQRDRWPSTRFFRGDHKAGYTVVYDDRDPSEVVAEYKASDEELSLPSNDFFGDLALQVRLSEIFRNLDM